MAETVLRWRFFSEIINENKGAAMGRRKMNDWRINNRGAYLSGADLIKLEYSERRSHSDHDH